MVKRIDVNEAKEAFEQGAAAAGEKWKKNFLATSGMADAAKSDDAQAAYVAKMQDAAILQKRQDRLAGLTDSDFKEKVRASGSTLYTTGVRGTKEKWARNYGPIADAINDVLPTLPPRTADPMTNLVERAGPVVMAAHKAGKDR